MANQKVPSTSLKNATTTLCYAKLNNFKIHLITCGSKYEYKKCSFVQKALICFNSAPQRPGLSPHLGDAAC